MRNLLKKNNWFKFVPLALLGAAGLYFWHTYPHFVVDDAFITARYARNLAFFGELNWNPGLDPVEGYTGILLPLLLAGVMAVFPGLDFALMPAVYGTAAFLGAGWLLWSAWNEQRLPWPLQSGLMAVFVSAPCIHPHIFAGLETLIFIFFVVLATKCLAQVLRQPRTGRLRSLMVSLLLCGLTRPEGAALAGIYLMVVLLYLWRKNLEMRAFFLQALVWFVLPGLLYFFWRWEYYGHLLPNTYYVKQMAESNLGTLTKMVRFTRLYLLWLLPWVGLLLWVRHRGRRGDAPAEEPSGSDLRYVLLAVGTYMLVTLGVYSFSTLAMDYANRFFAPYLPLALILAAGGAGGVLSRLNAAGREKVWAVGALMLIAAAQIGLVFPQEYFREKRIAKHYQTAMNVMHIPAGKALKESLSEDDWLVAVIDAGAIPYYSERLTVDAGQLNDEHLAHVAKNESEQIDYIFAKDPGAFAVISYQYDRMERDQFTERLVTDDRFSNYRLVQRYRTPYAYEEYYGDYFLFIYLREDIEWKTSGN